MGGGRQEAGAAAVEPGVSKEGRKSVATPAVSKLIYLDVDDHANPFDSSERKIGDIKESTHSCEP